VGGGNAQRLATALEQECSLGRRAFISFGIAGGLVEGLSSGTWLVGRSIGTQGRRWQCDMRWTRALSERLPGALSADLAGVDAPVMDPLSKRALREATGAMAVDTESHVTAAIAASHGLPFAAFRVVADSAQRNLPPAATVAIGSDGRIKRGAVLGSLARVPGQLPLLLRTAVDARSAFSALLRGRRLLGPGLAYPDLGEFLVDVP
jgi:hopanoid-associated phosphorylase